MSDANPIGARKNAAFLAVCTAPSINQTPVGPATVPLPYPTIQDLSNSTAVARSVRFNGDQVMLLSQSMQPSCTGDAPGTAKGVKSGTVSGEVRPTGASARVRVEGHQVVRAGDPNLMNGGNNPGIYLTSQTPSGAAATAQHTSNPPIRLETPAEESMLARWWNETKVEIAAACDAPVQGLIGAAKGVANIPSELAEVLLKGSALQGAAEMEQAAALQAAFGQDAAAARTAAGAADARAGAAAIDVPKLSLNGAAQRGGDKLSTGVQVLAAGEGLFRGGLKALVVGGKAASAEAKTIAKASGTAEHAAGAIKTGEEAAASAKPRTALAEQPGAARPAPAPQAPPTPNSGGAGVKIVKRIKFLREQYLGRTPGKASRTGREVIERMRAEGKVKEGPKGTVFRASDKEWYPLNEADMTHKVDAVSWWNQTGRYYGPKSAEVRTWMLDADNYVLDHFSINRSAGGKLTEQYLPPITQGVQ